MKGIDDMTINPKNYNLKPVRNMPRITRKEFGDNLDEILEKIEKENIAYPKQLLFLHCP